VKCPSTGGKNWPPSAYNPQLNLLFFTSVEGCNIGVGELRRVKNFCHKDPYRCTLSPKPRRH
jgi:hypothetical protein